MLLNVNLKFQNFLPLGDTESVQQMAVSELVIVLHLVIHQHPYLLTIQTGAFIRTFQVRIS